MTPPDLIPWTGEAAKFKEYIGHIYERFLLTFIKLKPTFLGKPISVRRTPEFDGKHYGFWHIVSESVDSGREEDRIPNLRRCERIEWIGFVISNAANKDKILCWIKYHTQSERRVHLYLADHRFLVVLAERDSFYVLVTAFYIERDHTHTKKLRDAAQYPDPRV
jgi:hypothetical protein